MLQKIISFLYLAVLLSLILMLVALFTETVSLLTGMKWLLANVIASVIVKVLRFIYDERSWRSKMRQLERL